MGLYEENESSGDHVCFAVSQLINSSMMNTLFAPCGTSVVCVCVNMNLFCTLVDEHEGKYCSLS